MTATTFKASTTKPALFLEAFREAGVEIPTTAFQAMIRVGDDGVSRGVPHVNNAEYVRWIDQIAELATDAAGFTRAEMLAKHRMWFVARHEIDYRGEAFEHDELLVATWLLSWTRTTVHRATTVVNASRPRVICAATTRWAYVNLESRRPVRIPPDMQAAFPDLPVSRRRES